MDKREDEYFQGEPKPCWCCAKNLKTAAVLVAIGMIYSHVVVLFSLLAFYVFDRGDSGDMKKEYQMALFITSAASCFYIPFGFLLLVGVVRDRIWMCSIWFYVIAVGTLLDFGTLALHRSPGFIIFQICFFLIRLYLLYVIYSYITLAKQRARLLEVWDESTKSIDVDRESFLSDMQNQVKRDEAGDTVFGRLDIDNLSIDSAFEKIKVAQVKEKAVLEKSKPPQEPAKKAH